MDMTPVHHRASSRSANWSRYRLMGYTNRFRDPVPKDRVVLEMGRADRPLAVGCALTYALHPSDLHPIQTGAFQVTVRIQIIAATLRDLWPRLFIIALFAAVIRSCQHSLLVNMFISTAVVLYQLFGNIHVDGEPLAISQQLENCNAKAKERASAPMRVRDHHEPDDLATRQTSTDGRCGTGFGTVCWPDECCSSAG